MLIAEQWAPVWGHYVMGLKRQAAAPIYQSNCFVGSTDDPTPYQIRLFGPSGVQLGNTISGSLTAYQVVRYLDVFAAAGLPAGDYSNVTAEFRADPSPVAALVSFCTVPESTFFSADFRMALPAETMDATRQRQLAINTANSYVVDALTMTRYDLGIRHPDHVRCWLTSGWGAVGIRVIAPDGNFVAGGDAITDTGTFYTGDRSLYNGFSNYWHMDISARPDYAGPFPVLFSFNCAAGNGMSINTIPVRMPDEF